MVCVEITHRQELSTNWVIEIPSLRAVHSSICFDHVAMCGFETEVAFDRLIRAEGFSYELASGKTGTVHIEQVLAYNSDPSYLRDQLLYKLTLEAQRRVAKSPLSKREIIRRLGTSATQFYRLLDQTNYSKSVDQLVSLLQVLDCEVDLLVRKKSA